MIPDGTSTGSKRPDLLFGPEADGVPRAMVRSEGATVWDDRGRGYTDFMMALGAVSLGYAHPDVVAAAKEAADDGAVGPLPPVWEARLADAIAGMMPSMEAVRFLKTGAEAVAAAVRIARVATGRERIVTVGYQGWLDPFSTAPGVPRATVTLRTEVPFNEPAALVAAVDDTTAAIVVEPVVDGAPTEAWVAAVAAARDAHGALLIVDEIKTGVRLGRGGASAAYGFPADLIVLGKALGNGFPIAAVGGAETLMREVGRTWISSTLATEFVSLAAAGAVLRVYERDGVAEGLAARGGTLWAGLQQLAGEHPAIFEGVAGIPQFCYLRCRETTHSFGLASGCARRGLLFKRDAYNFISHAHTPELVDEALNVLADVAGDLERGGAA